MSSAQRKGNVIIVKRVAIIGENSTEYVNILFDIWNAGNCAVLIDWHIPGNTAVKMMVEAGVSVCYIDKQVYGQTAFFQDNHNINIKYIMYDVVNRSACFLDSKCYEKYNDNYSKDEAVIIYSSGTTGNSKGIILSHYAITRNADAIIKYMCPQVTDCLYTIRPFSHSSTLTGELLVAVKSKCKLLISPVIITPKNIFRNIGIHNVSIICLNPKLLDVLTDAYDNKNPISSLKTIYTSGSVLNSELLSKAKMMFQGVNIYNVYGLTEAGPRVSAQRYDCMHDNSVGKPIEDVNIIVVDEYGNQKTINEKGYIHILTPSRYIGYVTGEEKYNSYYKNWMNTGDIGYFDEYNELHVVGRSDDVIFIESHKIYPDDIVSKIIKHADIDECVVVGVRYKSKDILCCVYSSKKKIRKDINSILEQMLMKYEIPKIYIKNDYIKRTKNGKVKVDDIKKEVIKQIEDMSKVNK